MNPADSADVELDQLIELFYSDQEMLGRFEEVAVGDLPSPSNELLAHDRHMTVTVERFHDCPVDVKVFDSRFEDDHYSRKIVLTRQSDDAVVMFGIVRLDMSVLSEQVRTEIESRKTPLGRILIQHNVMRAVKLLNLFRIEAGKDLCEAMNLEIGSSCYGRTALIFCDGAPAIELLEIVAA